MWCCSWRRFPLARSRASGADLERLHWLRNVEFANAGKRVTDQQQAFDFFYDTAAPLTTINQRMADSLGLAAMDASFLASAGRTMGMSCHQ